jgi:hypothetical protein
MPLLQDQELAQFFTNKTKEWKDKEERPLRAPRMPPKDRGKAVFQSYRETHSILGSTVGASLGKLTEVHRMDPRGTGSFSS